MSETRCMTLPTVLTSITRELDIPPVEDVLDTSRTPIDEVIQSYRKSLTMFLVSVVYYLLLFLFIHTIFQDSKGHISYRMREWFHRHYMLRRFTRREDGGRNKNPAKSLLLCALAHQFPKKSNTDLLEMMREQLSLLERKHPGRIGSAVPRRQDLVTTMPCSDMR